jgi:hypothetical protein
LIANISLKSNVENTVEDISMILEYSDFLVVYLLHSKKGNVKITNLTLRLNKIPIQINDIARLWCVKSGYVEIVNHKKKYIRVKLTSKGYLAADAFTFLKPIVKRTYLRRFIYLLIIIFKELKELFLDLAYIIFSKETYFLLKVIGVIVGIVGGLLGIYSIGKQMGLF